MNYAMNISNRTEDVMRASIEELRLADESVEVSAAEQDALYKAALHDVLEADGKAWADGDIRIGEYILIIDSDTRVVSYPLNLPTKAPNILTNQTARRLSTLWCR